VSDSSASEVTDAAEKSEEVPSGQYEQDSETEMETSSPKGYDDKQSVGNY